MKRLLMRMVAAVALIVALAACSAPGADGRLSVRMEPTVDLGYEVDDTGAITVTTRTLIFRNGAGDAAATIDGVHAAFFDASGALVGEWTPFNDLSIVVPAGFQCTAPDPVLGCTRTSPGAVAAPGQESAPELATTQLLSGDVATAHAMLGSPIGWYGEFTFSGHDYRGPFEVTKTYYIVAPN